MELTLTHCIAFKFGNVFVVHKWRHHSYITEKFCFYWFIVVGYSSMTSFYEMYYIFLSISYAYIVHYVVWMLPGLIPYPLFRVGPHHGTVQWPDNNKNSPAHFLSSHMFKISYTQSWTKYIGRMQNLKKKDPPPPPPIFNVEFFCDSDCRTFFNIEYGGRGRGEVV